MSQFDELFINGIHFKKEDLLKKVSDFSSQTGWEADFWQFVGEWLTPTPTIEVHTSGSTGTPKRMLLEKKRMVCSAQMTGAFFQLTKGEKVLLPLSTNYIAGKMMVVRAFVLGLDLYPIKPSSNPLMEAKGHYNFVPLVPMQVYNGLETPEIFKKVRKILIGGGPVSSTLEKEIQQLPTLFYHSFGMTETISHIAVRRLNGPNASSLYHALPKVHLEIDDRECLIIKAPDITPKPLLTNDMVELYSSSSFRWLGRFDNVINSGGIKIFPEELEKKMEGLISKRFFLTGEPNPKLGQQLILVIEDMGWSLPKQEELLSLVKKILPRHQAPRKIFFLPKFQETPTGKIIRRL